MSIKKDLEIGFCWARERLHELWSGNLAPASANLRPLDATMAMAAVRGNMKVMKRMICLGANPAVKEFLAYRMAALNGDMDAIASIESVAMPSEYALNDALQWAMANGGVTCPVFPSHSFL